jgi:hypothetical protein
MAAVAAFVNEMEDVLVSVMLVFGHSLAFELHFEIALETVAVTVDGLGDQDKYMRMADLN